MKPSAELVVSLALSPWSLGLKRLLRGADTSIGELPRGDRLLALYPAAENTIVPLIAWIYWLTDGCSTGPLPGTDKNMLILDCSLSRVHILLKLRETEEDLQRKKRNAVGAGRFMIDGNEYMKLVISPGAAGGIRLRHQDRNIPWIFPEGDGQYYCEYENASRILPAGLIDEALDFADAFCAGN